jgi:hypothetical protein
MRTFLPAELVHVVSKRIGKIRQVAASKVKDRKNQTGRGEQGWGLAPPSMPGAGCWRAAPSVRRIGYEGYEVKGDEVDRNLAMKGQTGSAEPMASARQEGSLRSFF